MFFVSSFSRVVKRSHLHILAPRLICSIRHCFWNVPPLMEKNAAHHNGMWSWAQGEMACFIWVLVGSVGFSISHCLISVLLPPIQGDIMSWTNWTQAALACKLKQLHKSTKSRKFRKRFKTFLIPARNATVKGSNLFCFYQRFDSGCVEIWWNLTPLIFK